MAKSISDGAVPAIPVFPRGRRHLWVADGLRKDMMLGRIEPGAAITELEIATRFQCSQSTVREALLLLQEEGLVQRAHHRGTRVSASSEDEALELQRLRRDIECRGAQSLFGPPGREDAGLVPALRAHLAAMVSAAESDDQYALAEADRDFHRRLFAASRRPNVEPMLLRCLIHNHRHKILSGRGRGSLRHAAERHVPIIEAVERRDGDGLVAVLDHHVSTLFGDGLGATVQTTFRGDSYPVPESAAP